MLQDLTFRPRAVIFDYDGVLKNSEELTQESFRAAARMHDIDLSNELLSRTVGRSIDDTCRILLEVAKFEHIVEQIRQNAARYIWDKIGQNGLEQCRGVDELLDLLDRQNIPRAIASSSDREWIERTMGKLHGRFHTVVALDDVTKPKPDPEGYLLAAKRLNVPAAECLAIEDSEAGVKAASSAGIRVIMVPSIPVAPSSETVNLALAVMPSLEGVTAYIKKVFGP